MPRGVEPTFRQLMRPLLGLLVLLLGGAAAAAEPALGRPVALEQRSGGSLYARAEVGGVEAAFLLDTGAGLVTLERGLFERLTEQGQLREVRRVAARLANNRLRLMTVYEVQSFRVGGLCDLGPVEVAVMEKGGRNLLGLSALAHGAPFTIHTSPPSLVLSHCGQAHVAAVD